MPWLVLGVLLLIGGLLVARGVVTASPAQLARAVRVLGVVFGGAAVVWLAVTGRLAVATMLLGALLPMFMRLQTLRRMWRNASGPKQGQTSEIGTRFLRMTLDHDTGAMTGTILDGPQRGRALNELAPEEQIALLRGWRVEDPDSAALLEAWLDRTRPEWRQSQPGGAGEAGAGAGAHAGAGEGAAPGGRMSQEEAWHVLGLEPGASEAEIKAAHRALMQKLHPDVGGSGWLAARVNEAKDVLLGG